MNAAEEAILVIRKPSITPSGFFGSGLENIVELENFMTRKKYFFWKMQREK